MMQDDDARWAQFVRPAEVGWTRQLQVDSTTAILHGATYSCAVSCTLPPTPSLYKKSTKQPFMGCMPI
jgi:hypothetical protein